jgi:hypothetical protein
MNTVKLLLGNTVYVGEARNGVHRLPDAHPPIVSQEVFVTVQALSLRPEPRALRSGTRALLAGVARCASCGYALERNRVSNGYLVYRCSGRRARGACSAAAHAMAPALDELVTEIVLENLESFDVEQVPIDEDVGVDQLRLFENDRVAVLSVREVWATLTVDEQRAVLWAAVDTVAVSRASRTVPLADRVAVYWTGDELPFEVPRRGRPAGTR